MMVADFIFEKFKFEVVALKRTFFLSFFYFFFVFRLGAIFLVGLKFFNLVKFAFFSVKFLKVFLANFSTSTFGNESKTDDENGLFRLKLQHSGVREEASGSFLIVFFHLYIYVVPMYSA